MILPADDEPIKAGERKTEGQGSVLSSIDFEAEGTLPRRRYSVVGMGEHRELRCLIWPCEQTGGKKVGVRFEAPTDVLGSNPHDAVSRLLWTHTQLAMWRLSLWLRFRLYLPDEEIGVLVVRGASAALRGS